MEIFRIIINFLIFLSVFVCHHAAAQTAGDEDKDMINKAKARDQKAIDEARNGWWAKSMTTQEQRIQWWRDAKFGMFIHWGIYSLPGGEWKGKKITGYAEHLMRKEKISRAEYLELANRFNPVKFNAEEWVRHAQRAGMKYFIITAKHHDGFALFDSRVSDFDIMDQTSFKRDPMAELSEACKKLGMNFGFYYSHAFDWEHPDAPGNDWELNNPGGDRLLGGANWYDTHPAWLPKASRYVNEKAIPQIKELLINYNPDILWFDTPHKLPLSENIRILKAIREIDPDVVVNGRLARSSNINFGDYKNTADRPAEFYPVEGDWEAIPTTNESYGYHKYDSSHKSVSHFIRLLVSAVSRGGNLLMNIGPRGDGAFDTKDIHILEGIGNWIEKNAESINAGESSLPLQSWGVSTYKDNKLYLHVFNWPADGKLYVGGLRSSVSRIFFLVDPNSPLKQTRIDEKDLFIIVPKNPLDTINTVIVVELKNKIEVDSVRYIASNVPVNRLLAYDAKLHGSGFKFGDGKADRYYIEGWTNRDQFLSWKIRTSDEQRFKINIKYVSCANCAGEYKLKINDTYEFGYTINSRKDTKPITEELTKLIIPSGTHSISLYPVDISKTELMKPLEIQLIPID
jgi:alpha-L-fucosidase